MRRQVLFIHGAGEGAYDEDGLIVASLRQALGPDYDVRYPRMPNEANPEYAEWNARARAELADLSGEVVLVGHSIGGSVLLKLLADGPAPSSLAGVVVMAAPFWGIDNFWRWDDVHLPSDVASRLQAVPKIVFYHSRDDEVVPFDHLALYAATIPSAVIREVDGRGHQFERLADVAEDIAGLGSGPSTSPS